MSNLKRSKRLKAFNEYGRMYNLYLADKNMLAFNFRILIAYENWPDKQYVNSAGNIIKPENKELKEALKIIDDEARKYLIKHYPMLNVTL